MLTSAYLTRMRGSRTAASRSRNVDDELFDYQTEPEVVAQRRSAIVKWLREASSTFPDATEGLDDSVVSWFLQSARRLPAVLGLSDASSDPDLASALKILIERGCLTKETISYLQKSCSNAPPPDLIWRILDDVHEYALSNTKVTVPLTRTKGPERPVILTQQVLSRVLRRLGLPGFPATFARRQICDDVFRNGKFLNDLYSVLSGTQAVRLKTAVSASKATELTQKALRKLSEKNFIDKSFIAAAPAIVNGNMCVLQQILSMIFWNVSITGKITRVKPKANALFSDQETEKDTGEKEFLQKNRIQDGVALSKLLTAIDPEFTIDCIFAEPKSEAERKWNVRKSIEFLMRKRTWPPSIDVNSYAVFDGEKDAVMQLFNGIRQCYPMKFASLSAVMSLKQALGLV